LTPSLNPHLLAPFDLADLSFSGLSSCPTSLPFPSPLAAEYLSSSSRKESFSLSPALRSQPWRSTFPYLNPDSNLLNSITKGDSHFFFSNGLVVDSPRSALPTCCRCSLLVPVFLIISCFDRFPNGTVDGSDKRFGRGACFLPSPFFFFHVKNVKCPKPVLSGRLPCPPCPPRTPFSHSIVLSWYPTPPPNPIILICSNTTRIVRFPDPPPRVFPSYRPGFIDSQTGNATFTPGTKWETVFPTKGFRFQPPFSLRISKLYDPSASLFPPTASRFQTKPSPIGVLWPRRPSLTLLACPFELRVCLIPFIFLTDFYLLDSTTRCSECYLKTSSEKLKQPYT